MVCCGSMLAFSIGNVYDSIDELFTTGKFSGDFVEIFAIQSSASYYSAWTNVVTILVVAFNALCMMGNWMVFIPGLVGCIVIFTISGDYLRFIDQCKGDEERFLKVVQ